MTRVLILAPRYYPHIGGVENVVRATARRLAERGVDVAVLAGERRVSEPRESLVEGVRVYRWPVFSPGDAYHVPRRPGELARLVERLAERADIVHVHSVHSVFTVYAGLVAGRRAGARLVVTPHYHGGGHTLLRSLAWRLWRLYVGRLIDAADAVHVVSVVEGERVSSHFKSASGKLVVIPNGVEPDVYNYRWSGGGGYLAYAGRLEKYKNIEDVIMLAREMGLDAVIVGAGPHRGRLSSFAERVYPGRVKLIPPQPRDSYLSILSRAEYAVNPSEKEAFSIFIAESLAIGAPAIVSRELARIWGDKCSERRVVRCDACRQREYVALSGCSGILDWDAVVDEYLRRLYRV